MRRLIKFAVILAVFFGLLFFGISKYDVQNKINNRYGYFTSVKRKDSAMLISGMAKDRKKIESFKNDFERDDDFNKYWDQLHLASKYRKQGDYEKAIFHRQKSLEFAHGVGQRFQTKMGLAKIYEMNKQYVLAIKEYEWCVGYSKRPDVIKKLKTAIERIEGLKAETAKK